MIFYSGRERIYRITYAYTQRVVVYFMAAGYYTSDLLHLRRFHAAPYDTLI